jgi:stage IV sporulation protein A
MKGRSKMSENYIKHIIKRTDNELYLGVVGPVRSGKSTFIKKFVETLVLPNVNDENVYKRVIDELPQSSDGRQIMTTEPKFVPNNAVELAIEDLKVNVRLVDCVGFVIPNSLGYEAEEGPRMVHTPWFEEAIPFKDAAALGTKKVIKDHSTIGIVMTTDGSISDFNREDYITAEEQTIEELNQINKPFIVVLNSRHPGLEETVKLSQELQEKYQVPVVPLSVDQLSMKDINTVLKEALYEFQIKELNIKVPNWFSVLRDDHALKQEFNALINNLSDEFKKVREVNNIVEALKMNEFVSDVQLTGLYPEDGACEITVACKEELYNEIIEGIIGHKIEDRGDFVRLLQDYNEAKIEYDTLENAIKMVKQVGYGIATPRTADMQLDKPEIIKSGPRYGVKFKAIAPSIHMIKVDITSTFEPIIGTKEQSEALIDYIMQDYAVDPSSIWNKEIFGRTLDEVVIDGIRAKLFVLPDKAKAKLKETLERVINQNSAGMIAIIL